MARPREQRNKCGANRLRMRRATAAEWASSHLPEPHCFAAPNTDDRFLGPSCAGLTRASIKKSFICQIDGLPGQARQ
jgi:hypothetical protein